MTERRRFFPARPVQQVPGRTVELAMQLRTQSPQAASVAASGAPGDAAVALLPDMLPVADDYYYDPETGAALHAVSGIGLQNVYRTVFDAWRLVGGYVTILGPAADMGGVYTLRAVVVGSAVGSVAWTWTLDTPAFPGDSYTGWWDGVTVESQDGTLRIRVLAGEMEDWVGPWWATLTCSATVDGVAIGSIVLRPGFNFGDYGTLPLPV